MKTLKILFWVVDLGFVLYWLITLLHLIPPSFLFKDYDNPILSAWNWSFLPLDLLISTTGMLSLWRFQRHDPQWRSFALISLVLTFCSGLQAIAYWGIRGDFDPFWWGPNLFLLLYPLFFIRSIGWPGEK
ncbi:MAG: DUF5360 family protein [Caldilineaceae bacterium]